MNSRRPLLQAEAARSVQPHGKQPSAQSGTALFLTICASGCIGAIAALGWAPFDFWPATLLAYAALFWMLQSSPGTASALLTGLAFGIGLHAAGHGWMYTALHMKAGLGAAAAMLSTMVFVGYLAFFTALPCMAIGAIARNGQCSRAGWADVLVFAALLTLGEWLRSVPFNGFTSLSVGYLATDLWISGFVPVGGLYLASFLLLIVAASIGRAMTSGTAMVSSGVAVAAIFAIGAALAKVQWTAPFGQSLTYRLIQSNASQARKFEPGFAARHARLVTEIIEQASADVVLTPETTFTTFLDQLPGGTLVRLREFSRKTSSHLFLGIVTASANSDGYNSLLEIVPDRSSDRLARYDKVRLMPFGEFAPSGFAWFTENLNVPFKDMSAGHAQQAPLMVVKAGQTVRIGVLICHEEFVGRDAARWGATTNLMLNAGNFAWFEGTLAIDQALQIARMRAMEIERPMLRAVNTGITAQIDTYGNVVQRLPLQLKGVLAGTVQPVVGATPYARLGDNLALLLCGIAMVPIGIRRTRSRMRNTKKAFERV